MANKLPPFYQSAHLNLETCAHPGTCSNPATINVMLMGVELGFCEPHGQSYTPSEAPVEVEVQTDPQLESVS